jgi:hypothetical protein
LNSQYEAGEKPTALKLKKQFNAIRREHYPWTWEVTKNASDQGTDLPRTANTPMARLQRQGNQVIRKDIWPTEADYGLPALLAGGDHIPNHSSPIQSYNGIVSLAKIGPCIISVSIVCYSYLFQPVARVLMSMAVEGQ